MCTEGLLRARCWPGCSERGITACDPAILKSTAYVCLAIALKYTHSLSQLIKQHFLIA